MRVVLGLSFYLFSTVSTISPYFFPGPISIRTDILWAQLLLDFSTDYLETMHTCSTWSEDVRVVLGYSAIIFFFLSTFCTFSIYLFFFRCDTMTWIACGRNSSYSFIPNFLKFLKFSLRKHAYSNIQKKFTSKNWKCSHKKLRYFSYFC